MPIILPAPLLLIGAALLPAAAVFGVRAVLVNTEAFLSAAVQPALMAPGAAVAPRRRLAVATLARLAVLASLLFTNINKEFWL